MAAVSITAANVLKGTGAKTRWVKAGGAVTQGQVVYEDGADNQDAKAALGDVVATADVAGIALNAASDGQPLEILYAGQITIGGTVVLGETYMLSAAAAGSIVPVGDIVATNSPTIIGMAITTGIIELSLNTSGILHA